jgi:hypothetical protein
MRPATKQLLKSALALPNDERLHFIEALTIGDLHHRAAWVLVVGAAQERCMESYPCQHSWTFPVERVLKGEGIRKEISIHGRYRDHRDIPEALHIAHGDGKFILFVADPGGSDTTVLGVVPWSEEAGALLTGL